MTPPSPSSGQQVQFRATLWVKVGPVSNLKIIGGVDGAKIFERVFPHLDRQAIEEVSFQWTSTAGSHKAWFQIDPDETTQDENRSDNRTEKRFSVTGSGGGGGPTATLTINTSFTKTTTTFTATTLKPHIVINSCLLSENLQTDLLVTEFTISSGNNENEKRYTVKIKNTRPRCLKLVHWVIVSTERAGFFDFDSSYKIIKNGQFGPTTGNNWIMEAGEVLTASGVINKSSLSNFGRCVDPDANPQTSIWPFVSCSHIRLMVDHLNEINETSEDNNNSQVILILWN